MSIENPKFEKPKESLKLIRVKTEPNGNYELVSPDEFKKMEEEEKEGKLHIYESYEFNDVKYEEDGSTTGVNYGGERITIEEKD